MSNYHINTKCIQDGYTPKNGEPRVLPIYQSTTFKYDSSEHVGKLFDLAESGFFYSRIGNPTVDAVEQKIASLEGGIGAICTSSGQAANALAVLNICGAGDHIISSAAIYGGTSNLFAVTMKKMGIDVTFINPDASQGEVQEAFRENTKLLFAETLSNPTLVVTDIEKFAKLAHKNGIPLIIDNTFGTPYLVRPIEYGADVVVHSATKFIGGHGTTIGGIIVDGGKFDWAASGKFPDFTTPDESYNGLVYADLGPTAFATKARVQLLRNTGATLSPQSAFYFLLGLESLSLRVERHVENTRKVVQFLSKHPKVSWINYPELDGSPYKELAKKYLPKGAGSIFTFGIKGGSKAGKKFINSVKLFSLLANVADAKSLVIHPSSTTHSELNEEQQKTAGVTPDLVRLSIGVEGVQDLIDDLEQALAQV